MIAALDGLQPVASFVERARPHIGAIEKEQSPPEILKLEELRLPLLAENGRKRRIARALDRMCLWSVILARRRRKSRTFCKIPQYTL